MTSERAEEPDYVSTIASLLEGLYPSEDGCWWEPDTGGFPFVKIRPITPGEALALKEAHDAER